VSGLDAQVFRAGTELVTVPATVTSRDGSKRVDGLTAADFRVTEDGIEQRISFVDQERRPVSICILLDASSSMREPLQSHARIVVQGVLASLLADDEVSLVVFAKDIQVPIQWVSGAARPRVNWQTYILAEGTALKVEARDSRLRVRHRGGYLALPIQSPQQ
jgi:hypothetical protein